MSHYVVLVVMGKNDDVDEMLEPFNESKTVPRYVLHAKAELIAKGRKDIQEYAKDTYAEYIKDPEAYAKRHNSSPEHLEYLKNEFPKKLNWTDEEIYKSETTWYEPDQFGKDGEVYSTSNPNGKWDWYGVGGRWAGFWKLKKGRAGIIGEKSWTNEGKEIDGDRADIARKEDIDYEGMLSENFQKASKRYDEFEALLKSDPVKAKNDAYWTYGVVNMGDSDNWKPESREQYLKKNGQVSTFAVLKDGKWYERGEMGWWGAVGNEKDVDEWQNEWNKLIASVPNDTTLAIVDCHI